MTETTTTPDVNQAFFNTRTAAWDRAEYAGKDGLDTTLGQAALYTTTPAWHGLGNVVPGGTSDVGEVLTLGGINFLVELRDVRYNVGGELRTFKDKYVTVRDDTGDALGVVGKRYTPIQNRSAFDFLTHLVRSNDVTWESAGATRNGRNVFVSLRLPENVTIDPGGINEDIIPFIVALNSHDGTSPFRVVVTPWRPVCRNTERFAVQDAFTSWSVRHTVASTGKIEEARRTLGLSQKYYEQFAAEETALARTDVTLDEFDKLINSVWELDDKPSKQAVRNAGKRNSDLHTLFAAESQRVGRTGYAAERSVSGYLDNLTPIMPPKNITDELARAARIMDGTDDAKKSAAHKKLMLLTNR